MFRLSIQNQTFQFKKQTLLSLEISKEQFQVLFEVSIFFLFFLALESRGFEPDENMQNLVQKQVTKTILKMLLGAIQQEADDRGYEICTMFDNPQQGSLFHPFST